MDSFLHSALLIGISEMGDKTQLLAIFLAARYRKFWAVMAGIFLATTLNHLIAAWAGQSLSGLVSQSSLQWIVGISFIALGLWALKPDSMDGLEPRHDLGAFLTALGAFFIVEIGDKTQFATIALAAEYHNLVAVVAGTTVGMMIANIPAVLFGHALLQKLPLHALRYAAAALFIGFGLWEIGGMYI